MIAMFVSLASVLVIGLAGRWRIGSINESKEMPATSLTRASDTPPKELHSRQNFDGAAPSMGCSKNSRIMSRPEKASISATKSSRCSRKLRLTEHWRPASCRRFKAKVPRTAMDEQKKKSNLTKKAAAAIANEKNI